MKQYIRFFENIGASNKNNVKINVIFDGFTPKGNIIIWYNLSHIEINIFKKFILKDVKKLISYPGIVGKIFPLDISKEIFLFHPDNFKGYPVYDDAKDIIKDNTLGVKIPFTYRGSVADMRHDHQIDEFNKVSDVNVYFED